MDELRVPKHRVCVELVFAGGATMKAALFLGDHAHHHSGDERVSDLLSEGPDFLPAHDLDRDAMTIIHRQALRQVRVEADLEVEAAEQTTIPTEHEVELLLDDGALLTGVLTYVLPEHHARLNDYLNQRTPFLRLVEKERVTFVNKRHVLRVDVLRR